MYDRNVEYPNRYQLVKVEGTDDIFDLVPAPGRVDNDGTLINKNSLLKDATAALFDLGADTVPDDVFAAIKSVLNAHESSILSGPKVETGSYVGTGTYGESNPNSLTFSFAPKIVIMLASYYNKNNIYQYFGSIGGSSTVTPSTSPCFRYVMAAEILTDSYTKGLGFQHPSDSFSKVYGKKSADGKTFMWYQSSSDEVQMNRSGWTYYYLAIS